MARGRRSAAGSHVCLHTVHFWRQREPAPGLGWLAWAGWHLFLDLSISKKIRLARCIMKLLMDMPLVTHQNNTRCFIFIPTTYYSKHLTHIYTIHTMLRCVSLFLLFGCCANAFTSPFARGTRLEGVGATSSSSLCMKNIAVFGASGLTAAECVYQALENGDSVVGLTRNPSKLVIPKGSGGNKAGEPLVDHPNLTLIAGDATKRADVDKVFDSAAIDGVVVALGGKTSDVGETMLTDSTQNVINAMKDKGVKRLAVVTSIGAGDSEKQAPFFFKSMLICL